MEGISTCPINRSYFFHSAPEAVKAAGQEVSRRRQNFKLHTFPTPKEEERIGAAILPDDTHTSRRTRHSQLLWREKRREKTTVLYYGTAQCEKSAWLRPFAAEAEARACVQGRFFFFAASTYHLPPYSTQILVPLENRRGPRQKLSPPSHPDLISQSDKGGGKRKGRHHSRHPWRLREPQQQLWEEIWERISHGFAAGLLPFPGRIRSNLFLCVGRKGREAPFLSELGKYIALGGGGKGK